MRLPVIDDQRRRIADALRSTVNADIRFGAHDRMLYATDASIYQVEPIGVVIPDTVADGAEAVQVCADLGVPILPRGGGTSLAGQCTAQGVVIDLSATCRTILDVDDQAGTCRVEPGVVLDDLNAHLAPRGWFFAPDPATSRQCNVGGCIGNNAAGARSIKYGRTSENLIGVEACLSNARRVTFDAGAAMRDAVARQLTERVVDIVRDNAQLIRERFPTTLRRNAGYNLDLILDQIESGDPLETVNLAHLLAGSEGTLALTLGATLKLHRVPESRVLSVVAFESVDAAIAAVEPILATHPTAVELLDDMVINLAQANVLYRHYVEHLPAVGGQPPKAILYVEHAGSIDETHDRFEDVSRATGDRPMSRLTEPAAMAEAWKLRKAGEPLLHGLPGARKPATFVEDNAIPVEHLSEFVREFRDIVNAHGTTAAFFAHASVGVLHVRPLLDISDDDDRTHLREIAIEVADLAQRLGGVMSGEHGDGKVRGPLLERFYGPQLIQAFAKIKQVFDPHNLLNPGNIVGAGSIETITQRLRVEPEPGAPARVPDIDTYFDYADQHGFDGAVEMCNGAGLCRKSAGGTMCPSYMALRDERHTTRGRANALRLAITGQVGTWNDHDTLQTLDLCLSCKACKAECPSNVDLARLKSEYLAQSYAQGLRATWQTRLFESIDAISRLGARTPRLANAVNNLGLTRSLLQTVAGIDRRRAIPAFTRPLTRQWPPDHMPANAPQVVLLADTFTCFNEPEIGLATRRVLEAYGYRVTLIDAGDMGRAAISLGRLPRAIKQIDRALARWADLIDDDSIHAFLVCEPSCLSAIRDDWLQLRLRAPLDTRRRLAARAYLPEQFLDQHWDAHPARPRMATPDARLILHAHCHQKALWGPDSSAALLHRLFPGRVDVLDSGCCGMAGSFGYATHRYDLSMEIGGLSLFPSVRAAREDDVILATGTSCRQQIADGTQRQAVHPMVMLADRLA